MAVIADLDADCRERVLRVAIELSGHKGGKTKMVLFHGTSDKFLRAILTKGLRPRAETGKSAYEDRLLSHPDRVYLTDVHALAFASNAVGKFGGNMLVVAAQVDGKDLEPDTDFMEGGLHHLKFEPHQWEPCLKQTGCVSVKADRVEPRKLYRLTRKQTEQVRDQLGAFDTIIPTGFVLTDTRKMRADMLYCWLVTARQYKMVHGEWRDDLDRPVILKRENEELRKQLDAQHKDN